MDEVGRPLLFLHIEKTAGTAVYKHLMNRFPGDKFLDRVHLPELREQDPSHYEFVRGHIDFGYVARFKYRPMILTILRDPLERTLSAISYYAAWSKPTLVETPISRFRELVQRQPLHELLDREPELSKQVLCNIQTRALLASRPTGDPAANSEAWLTEAQDNLSQCDIVGLSERLDDSLKTLERQFGWQGLTPVPRRNVTKQRLRADGVDPRVLARLREWNQLDQRLYQFAVQRFDQQMTASQATGERTLCRLPDAETFDFAQPIHGSGWQDRERIGDHFRCWTRGDQEAWLDLAVSQDSPRWFRARVVQTIKPTLLDGLRVFVNHEELAVTRRRYGKSIVLEAPVPASALCGTRARITLRAPEGARPCDLSLDNPDARCLGIAFDKLCLSTKPPQPDSWANRLVRRTTQPLFKSLSNLWSPKS